METKCSIILLLVCLVYRATALPTTDTSADSINWRFDHSLDTSRDLWENYPREIELIFSQLDQSANEIDHENEKDQKFEEPHTEKTSNDVQSDMSSTEGFLSFDIEENTNGNEDYNHYYIIEEKVKSEDAKDNAKNLIMEALLKDDADQTKALIEELTGNFSGIDDIVWLGKASEKCKLNVAKMLIENGVSVEVHKADDWHPLHVAAYNGCDEVAKFLIDSGADVNIQNGNGDTSLNIALARGNHKIADLLTRNEAKTNDENSWHAWLTRYTTTEHTDAETTENNVNQRVVENIEKNIKDNQNISDMILDAISKDDEKDTENLIEDWVAGYLKMAAEKCKPKVAKMLIQNGVNVNIKYGKSELRPIHLATASDCEEVVKILVENGADINVKSGPGYTALHLAAKNGNVKITELLIKNGADIEIKDYDFFYGWTALEWAQSENNDAVVKVLIDNGAKQPIYTIETEETTHHTDYLADYYDY